MQFGRVRKREKKIPLSQFETSFKRERVKSKKAIFTTV